MQGIEGVVSIHRNSEERKENTNYRFIGTFSQRYYLRRGVTELLPGAGILKEIIKVVDVGLMGRRVMHTTEHEPKGAPMPRQPT